MTTDIDIRDLLEKGTVLKRDLTAIEDTLNKKTEQIHPYTLPAETYVRLLHDHVSGLNGSRPDPSEYRDLPTREKRDLARDMVTHLRWYMEDEYGVDNYLDDVAAELGLIPTT